jgi:hypothetical protein
VLLLLPIVRHARTLRQKPWVGILLLVPYVVCYATLSRDGEYVLSNHGGQDWRFEWCPPRLIRTEVLVRVHTSPTALGLCFLPCLLVDRCLWHPTITDLEAIFGPSSPARPG